jgi:REase_DpnII-MboI
LNQEEAINRFSDLISRAEQLVDRSDDRQGFEKWYRDTEITIEKIFGEQTRHIEDFRQIECRRPYQSAVKYAITVFESFIDEIKDWGFESSANQTKESSAIDKVQLIIERFHQVARQLQARHGDRNTIEIEDEYDVQDLFHALLKLYFDDIRPEEYTPSYAGSASRVDFLLKDEQIIIEIKKTRNGLKAKEVGEQLIIDTQKYQAHPDCKTLICFVYDPEGKIANPRGIEKDLSKDFNGLPVSVFITP